MKAVVCGAGISGLAFAQRLSALGWEVVVLEKSPGPRRQGYMIDFFGPGYDAAEAMGLLPRLHELGYRIDEALLVDDAERYRARLRFDQFARTVDDRFLSILRPDLELALRESLPADVELRFSTSVTDVTEGNGHVRVTLTDGQVLTADLCTGADGVHSAVRELVFGAEPGFLRYLGFHTTAFTFTDAAIRDRVADRFHLTDSIDRQFGLYGLRDGRVAAFAVHRSADSALPADTRAAVLGTYGSLGWVVPAALVKCPPSEELYYDQVAQIELPAWHRGRVVLIGDAAHAVSLLAGQGASLGVAGAFVLADQLNRADSLEAALAGYERLWRPVVTEKQRTARKGARWFLPRSRAEQRIRRVTLAMARLPGLDHLIASALAGKHTTLVRRLREQPETP